MASKSLLHNMSKAFTLLTAGTPNGHKASIFLEELRNTYGLAYKAQKINLGKNEQKEPWFIKLNPNGRIPVLIDHTRNDFPVFESGAILTYLQTHHDRDGLFGFPRGSNDESEMLQWIFFAHGGLGPMMGQATHFTHAAPEKIPYAINRYVEETKRLFGVLEIRLAERDWLAGPGRGKWSIADINALPWVKGHTYVGIENLDEFPRLKDWVTRGSERPSVKEGSEVPA